LLKGYRSKTVCRLRQSSRQCCADRYITANDRPVEGDLPSSTRERALELTAENLEDIESAASQIAIQGARYPEAMERMSNRWH
jgi:hypothetical protein